ncbi:tegument protein UL21 [Cervid alphaherpesvirus 1]|uniref:Tegument protein UL21 n=1 Tax=Cervid alphaherpesvirus 1 TaxID=79891 RepID=A0A455JIR0_9ALPH|nr:tegument protein UL21 [Cervid alphaherpesvirus 1]AVT50689.1 tegument protein UL21 [Cervid alphaherpesvirus 1]
MELAYRSVVAHNGVSFYVSAAGDVAYFVYAGTVVSVARGGEEAVKFGLELRGRGRGDRAVANYVRAELARAGPPAPPGAADDGDADGGGVFVDCLARLRPRGGAPAAGADLCGRFDVPVGDPYLAECFVSLGVASGLVLTTGYHDAERRVLHLFDAPTIANALSGFVYTPNRECFALMQACLPAPPEPARPLLRGLFERIAAAAGEGEGAGARAPATEVIVTAARAAGVRRVGARGGDAPEGGAPPARARRGAAVSSFVQVRIIPRTYSAWAMAGPPPRDGDPLPRLCAVVRCADAVVLKSDHWAGIDETLNEARGDLVRAAAAIFGPRGRRGFVGESVADYGFSFCQRFALCQFLLARWGMASCYGALEHLAESYAANYPHRAGAPLDEGTVADAANDVLRELCALGRFAEALARADLGEPPAPAAGRAGPGYDCDCEDGAAAARALDLEMTAVLCLASRHTRRRITETGSPEELRRAEGHVRAVLVHLYAGGGRPELARALARALGTASPHVTLMEVEQLTAFDRAPAVQHGVRYLRALVDRRLGAAGITPPSDDECGDVDSEGEAAAEAAAGD